MKIAPYIEKLNNSSEYKDFQKKNTDAFMIAGFFVLDFEAGKNIHQIDYYLPSKKKIAAFTLDRGVTVQILDTMNSKVPEKLDMKTKIDLDQLQGILEDEMKNRSITEDIKKIIAVVQNLNGKKIWNLNCVLSGMGILNAHVEDSSKTVLKMEKKNIMDFIQKMSPQALQAQNKPGSVQGTGIPAPVAMSSKDKLKKLNELEEAIEKEKQEVMKEESEANSKSQDKAGKVKPASKMSSKKK